MDWSIHQPFCVMFIPVGEEVVRKFGWVGFYWDPGPKKTFNLLPHLRFKRYIAYSVLDQNLSEEDLSISEFSSLYYNRAF